MNKLTQLPTLSRALSVAILAALITTLALYATLMETDYGKALFFTYDEIWNTAERQESAGNLVEAERLIRHIVAMEENRVTLRFGLFVMFAGPDYLFRARLELARLHWRLGRLEDADAGYREALAAIIALSGPADWRLALGEFRYAEFLAATGRVAEARQRLASAEALAQATLREGDGHGGAPWKEAEEAGRRSGLEDLLGKISALRGRHAME